MIEDLSELVDFPRETLEIEHKQWLDLSEAINRANLARHLAALANHGGGYLVFGFKDDLKIDPDRPPILDAYNHDAFSGIVKKYLTPTFQCDVSIVSSNAGIDYPVIRVPGHGITPICSVADGPHNENGRPQGIRMATYYIRKPGPESAPITSPQDWDPLIRRCTLNDRDTLFKDFSSILQGGEAASATPEDRLDVFHKNTFLRFKNVLDNANEFVWPVSLEGHCCQLSYSIIHDNEPISINDMRHVLEEINIEVRDTVWTGWSMFYPFTRPEIAPTVHPENSDGTGDGLLEANLIGLGKFDTTMPDFWRIAPDGRCSIIRGYREDIRSDEPGTWLSPVIILRETTELVRHARALVRYFPSSSAVSFRCTWTGLQGREFKDFDPSIYWSPGRISAANERSTSGVWPTVQLGAAWSNIVSELGCPILHLFGFTDCSPEFVESLATHFIKL